MGWGGGGGGVNSGFKVFAISNVFLCAINLIVLICKGADTKLPVIYSFQERDETGVKFSFRKYLKLPHS